MSSPKMDVVITAKDCADGIRNSEYYCVVATAIQRLQPGANRVEVNVNTIRFSMRVDGKTFRLVYRTPAVVADYVREFDKGQVAKPMNFTLDNPQVAEKLPTPKGKAKTPSFKPSESAKTRRSIRVAGEKTLQARSA